MDLRIKAGAALACDLSTRVGGANIAARPERAIALALSDGADRPWLPPVLYVAFVLAIAIPWVLLLADQLAG